MNILYIEDCNGDILLLEEFLEEINSSHNVRSITNGKMAIEFLEETKRLRNASSIDLIILDINLPCANGIAVLSKIKNDDMLKDIPVIIFSENATEMDECHKNSVLACFSKSTEFEENLTNITKMITLAEMQKKSAI